MSFGCGTFFFPQKILAAAHFVSYKILSVGHFISMSYLVYQFIGIGNDSNDSKSSVITTTQFVRKSNGEIIK
jgi:hypothetical protein